MVSRLTVREALIDHFGDPVIDQKVKERQRKLVWQAEGRDDSNRQSIEQLRADIRRVNGLTVIELFLEAPELAAQYTVVGSSSTESKSSKLKL